MKPLITYANSLHTYQVYRCTQDDIPVHVSCVEKVWQDTGTDLITQEERMSEAVDNGYAYYLTTDDELSAFLYYVIPSINKVAVAAWVRTYREAYIGMGYLLYNQRINRITFLTHSEKLAYSKLLSSKYFMPKEKAWLCSIAFNDNNHKKHIQQVFKNLRVV